MKRIAVLSDTHGKLPLSAVVQMADADEIWHLGDVTEPHTLAPLMSLGKPLRIIRGNCDECPDWPHHLIIKESGLRIMLEHIPPSSAPPGIDILLHGHTHIPRHERVGKTIFLNPGSTSRPKGGSAPSWAWLELDETGYRWTPQVL